MSVENQKWHLETLRQRQQILREMGDALSIMKEDYEEKKRILVAAFNLKLRSLGITDQNPHRALNEPRQGANVEY
jgi:hypothetical protein